jgi:dolichol-phosphate mannosyltransferase
MPTGPELVIVMPAYNEQGCIRTVVLGWLAQLASMGLKDYKLIVVNDGSRDQTGSILDALASEQAALVVVHQNNAGHGRALRNAYERAAALAPMWVFHVDSDDQFIPQDLNNLWSLRHSSDFILGLRAVRHDAFHRLVITRILRLLNFLAFGVFLKDANIPFRLIRGDYLKVLLDIVPPAVFAPNIFLSVLAARDGQALGFIPVQHRERETGKVSIVRWGLIKACLRCVRELLVFRMQLGAALLKIRRDRRP